jgi:hypothetical protein
MDEPMVVEPAVRKVVAKTVDEPSSDTEPLLLTARLRASRALPVAK